MAALRETDGGLLAIAASLTKLKAAGGVHRGDCPCCLSRSKESPPFLVDPKGSRGPHFHCFKCEAHGSTEHLWRFAREGTWQIEKREWFTVVSEMARERGIAVPERSRRGPNPEEQAAQQAREAWGIAHAFLRDGLRTHPDAAAYREDAVALTGGAASAELLAERVGFFPADGGAALDAHLATLGVTPRARVHAGLTPDDLAAFVAGPVLLRTAGTTEAAGLSQQTADGAWAHTQARGAALAPATFVRPATGQATQRYTIVVPDAEVALWLTGGVLALRAAGHAPDGDEDPDRKPLTTLADNCTVVVAGADDPLAADRLRPHAQRAVIVLAPPDTPAAEVGRLGATLAARGAAVRVATWPSDPADPEAPPTAEAVLEAVDSAPDFLAWQWAQLAHRPTVAGQPTADWWASTKVCPLIDSSEDPLVRAVRAHRARRMSGVAFSV